MLSLRALPLIAIALILYNALIFAGVKLDSDVLTIKMMSGGDWVFKTGDLIILVTIVFFFIEVIKSTFTGASAIVDHALSMVVFIVALLEFLMFRQAATSVFFFIVLLTLIDVVAGYTIGMRASRRDINFGSGDN